MTKLKICFLRRLANTGRLLGCWPEDTLQVKHKKSLFGFQYRLRFHPTLDILTRFVKRIQSIRELLSVACFNNSKSPLANITWSWDIHQHHITNLSWCHIKVSRDWDKHHHLKPQHSIRILTKVFQGLGRHHHIQPPQHSWLPQWLLVIVWSKYSYFSNKFVFAVLVEHLFKVFLDKRPNFIARREWILIPVNELQQPN